MPRESFDECFEEGFEDEIRMVRRTTVPNYAARTDAVMRRLILDAPQIATSPVTDKARRFDFGRKYPIMPANKYSSLTENAKVR